jgi:hypothetical protein
MVYNIICLVPICYGHCKKLNFKASILIVWEILFYHVVNSDVKFQCDVATLSDLCENK